MVTEYIKKILQSKVYEAAVETPINPALLLSKRFNNNILIKREDLQPVFSFKIRGAYNKIALLTKEEQVSGVIAASAGNHAQGVALAAQILKINATIVMPQTTPPIKVNSVKERKANVVLFGDTFNEAYEHAQQIAQKEKLIFIHPYDDPDVIAGQGTIAMEILHQHKGPLDAVFVPVGGGGLISGIALYIKYLKSDVKIIGVESEDSACLYEALKHKKRIILDHVGIFADGVAVKQIGVEPFKIAEKFVDEVVTVSTDEICAAIKDIFNDTRSITEPAGALAIAGLKKYIELKKITGQTLIAINSGANVNFDRLRHISARSEIGEKREGILAVTIPEEPGSFKTFCNIIGKRSITEFNYRYADQKNAHVFVGIRLKSGNEELTEIINLLKKHGYTVYDMTDNELAKIHIRYMVGGRVSNIKEEHVFRFVFPERPGALLNFLNQMNHSWNISMFHYRNHGAAYGRVFMGLQVPDHEEKQLEEFLNKLGYSYFEEGKNKAYRLFLC